MSNTRKDFFSGKVLPEEKKTEDGGVVYESDDALKGIRIFRFERLDASLDEVMAKISLERAFEVVLLTSSGSKDSPIEGIITQWDAARFSG